MVARDVAERHPRRLRIDLLRARAAPSAHCLLRACRPTGRARTKSRERMGVVPVAADRRAGASVSGIQPQRLRARAQRGFVQRVDEAGLAMARRARVGRVDRRRAGEAFLDQRVQLRIAQRGPPSFLRHCAGASRADRARCAAIASVASAWSAAVMPSPVLAHAAAAPSPARVERRTGEAGKESFAFVAGEVGVHRVRACARVRQRRSASSSASARSRTRSAQASSSARSPGRAR